MGRRIIYRIEESEGNQFSEDEWASVGRLQHWYNSEFSWSTGRIRFKRYVLFPNSEDFDGLSMSMWDIIANRQQALREVGLGEKEIITQMEKERLVIVKWGGYYDGCLASGFTRVADNEWNAFLVCDFLLKASTLLPHCLINVRDEGKFIKTGEIYFRNASVILEKAIGRPDTNAEDVVSSRRVFSVVDPEKYARHPSFQNVVPEYGRLKAVEKREIVKNWNWLGYDGRYDFNGDDTRGFDLNLKVRSFQLGE